VQNSVSFGGVCIYEIGQLMNAVPNSAIRLQLGRPGWDSLIVLLSVILGVVQVLLGGDALPAAMLSGATLFGLLAVQTAGVTTAIGILNLLLVGRLLLGAYLTKNIFMGEPVTTHLFAPTQTAAVMLLGFVGVWLGTILVTRIVRPIPLFKIPGDPRYLLLISIVCVVLGSVFSVAVRLAEGNEGDAPTGGLWGVAKMLASFRVVSLPALMLYLWRVQSRRWLTHPAVISLALLLFVAALLTSSKQVMAEPVAAYTLMALARYGWRHPIAWVCLPLAIASYHYMVFPIAQYARSAGTLYKDPREAARVTAQIVYDYATDSEFRGYLMLLAEESVHPNDVHPYLSEKLTPYGRFAMIGEADRLISVSAMFEHSGMETIKNALLVQVPSIVYPNKPQLGSGNFLGQYAGDLDPRDYSTQVSYGFMANAYNAFGMPAVLPLSAIASFVVLALVSVFTTGPIYANPWSIYAVAAAHQEYVESSFTGLAGVVHEPIVAFIVLIVVLVIDWSLRQWRTQWQVKIAGRRTGELASSPQAEAAGEEPSEPALTGN